MIAIAAAVGGAHAQTSAPPALTAQRDDVHYAESGSTAVYDNGTTDPDNDSGNEMSQWVQADDFELASDATIVAAEIDWFDTLVSAGWDGGIHWYLFLDDGGLPGAVFASGTGTEIATVPVSGSGSVEWYQTLFSLGTAVDLDAGVRYWLGVHWSGDFDYERDEVYWAYSSSQAFSFSQESELGTFDNWLQPIAEDRGFRLFSEMATVPAVTRPGVLALAAALLAGVTWVARRGRRARESA